MRVFVVGATGVLGRQVLPRLIERGHGVVAVVRQIADVERLRRLGIDAHSGDILDADSMREPLRGCDVALHLATAIPAPGPQRDWSRNDRIRREGTRNLLAMAQEQGAPAEES